MENALYMQPVDSTLRVIREIYPTESTTKFDKFTEFIKALTANTIPGMIGQAIETTGKVCSTLVSEKYKVKAIKYVADAYEVKCCSEVELARIKSENLRTQALTLYIEKSFQCRMDEINKEILLRSREIDREYSKSMRQIDAEHKQAILNMNLIAKEHLHDIDKRYATIIQMNESYCLLYRKYLMELRDKNLTPSAMIKEISNKTIDILGVLACDPSVSIDRINAIIDAGIRLIESIDKPDNYFVSFEEFIGKKMTFKDLNDGKI